MQSHEPRFVSWNILRGFRWPQVSLLELFFLTTFAAVAMGVYIFVSPFLAQLAGCVLVGCSLVRWIGCINVISGGLVGFCGTMVVFLLCQWVSPMDLDYALFAFLSAPSAGYVVGAFVAEFSNVSGL